MCFCSSELVQEVSVQTAQLHPLKLSSYSCYFSTRWLLSTNYFLIVGNTRLNSLKVWPGNRPKFQAIELKGKAGVTPANFTLAHVKVQSGCASGQREHHRSSATSTCSSCWLTPGWSEPCPLSAFLRCAGVRLIVNVQLGCTLPSYTAWSSGKFYEGELKLSMLSRKACPYFDLTNLLSLQSRETMIINICVYY